MAAAFYTAAFDLVFNEAISHQRAADAAGAQVHPPTDFAWKPHTSRVRDPSGNLVELTQS